MDWDAIGAIGEVLGAGLVAISLLYLAGETRKNSRAVDATASRDAAYHLSEFHQEMARDPELMRISMKAFSEEMPTYTAEGNFLQGFVDAVNDASANSDYTGIRKDIAGERSTS